MLERPDPLDRPHRAGTEPRAGAVGDAEIHRNAEQGDVELGGLELRQLAQVGRAEEGRYARERPHPPVTGEQLRRHPRILGIEDVAPAGSAVTGAQRVEPSLVHRALLVCLLNMSRIRVSATLDQVVGRGASDTAPPQPRCAP